jgi:hypothetical protein
LLDRAAEGEYQKGTGDDGYSYVNYQKYGKQKESK